LRPRARLGGGATSGLSSLTAMLVEPDKLGEYGAGLRAHEFDGAL
jgi:hypothetical protein